VSTHRPYASSVSSFSRMDLSLFASWQGSFARVEVELVGIGRWFPSLVWNSSVCVVDIEVGYISQGREGTMGDGATRKLTPGSAPRHGSGLRIRRKMQGKNSGQLRVEEGLFIPRPGWASFLNRAGFLTHLVPPNFRLVSGC